MPLKDLPAELRPREKLLSLGAGALSDVELLALLLRTGYKGKGVFELASAVLQHFGGLRHMLHATPQQLQSIKGLGPAKRSELAAVVELARRALAHQLREGPVFAAPQEVKDFVALHLQAQQREVFAVLFLDAQHRLLHWQEVFHGTLNQTSVYPREVLRIAMQFNAAAVILAHNHPSGSPEPSRADHAVTQTMAQALNLLDVRVLDHLVVGAGQVVSFAERGWM